MSRAAALAVTSLLAFGSLACDSGSGPSLPDGLAELRVAHLSPDAPAVDVWLDGRVVITGLAYREVTDHAGVPTGSHRVQVTPAGAATPIVIDAVLDFADGSSTTVAATGLLGDGSLGPIVLQDDRRIAAGAKVRFVHASPDAPAVDVALAGGPVLFGNVAFREADGYLGVDAGSYDLEVRVAGTSTVALPLPDVSLSGATNYTVFAVGRLSDGSLAALPVVDADR